MLGRRISIRNHPRGGIIDAIVLVKRASGLTVYVHNKTLSVSGGVPSQSILEHYNLPMDVKWWLVYVDEPDGDYITNAWHLLGHRPNPTHIPTFPGFPYATTRSTYLPQISWSCDWTYVISGSGGAAPCVRLNGDVQPCTLITCPAGVITPRIWTIYTRLIDHTGPEEHGEHFPPVFNTVPIPPRLHDERVDWADDEYIPNTNRKAFLEKY